MPKVWAGSMSVSRGLLPGRTISSLASLFIADHSTALPRRYSGKGMASVRILATGGTFDKEYNELTGELFFKSTHIGDMLQLGRCHLDVEIETLMMIDSLQMTDANRRAILERCRAAPE